MCVYVCVCVSVCLCLCVCGWVGVGVCVCVCVYACACMRVCQLCAVDQCMYCVLHVYTITPVSCVCSQGSIHHHSCVLCVLPGLHTPSLLCPVCAPRVAYTITPVSCVCSQGCIHHHSCVLCVLPGLHTPSLLCPVCAPRVAYTITPVSSVCSQGCILPNPLLSLFSTCRKLILLKWNWNAGTVSLCSC